MTFYLRHAWTNFWFSAGMRATLKTQPGVRPARIFRNPFLELFTRTSLIITMIHYPLVIAALIYIGVRNSYYTVSHMALMYGAGFLFWTLFEYVMHRYLFHISDHIRGTERFQYVVHGVHHHNPRDEERVFMPPVPGLLITVVIMSVNYIFMGKQAWFFTAGMVTGYLTYAWIHYNVHLKPPHRMFRRWWKHHALHHFKYPDKAFGVSSPLWDIVFRTMPPKETHRDREEFHYLN
jgi:sterol desaturase/sphingolipid hydroxylase (fatty acid hydroxylase superfamily)